MTRTATVRALRSDELDAYRRLRLAALTESPLAFSASADAEAGMPNEAWAERLRTHTDGSTRIVVAEAGQELVGLAGGIPYRGRARVVSVWVDPAWRHLGVAARLIEHVVGWAADAGYTEVQIETSLANPGPQALYRRLGFEAVDEPPPPDCAAVLVRPLTTGGAATSPG